MEMIAGVQTYIRKERLAMRPRRFLIVAAVLLVACVAVATFVLPAWIGPRLILTDEGNGYGQSRWHVHRPISIAYFFQNRTGTPLTVTSVTLSHALSPQMKVIGESILSVPPLGATFITLPEPIPPWFRAQGYAFHAVRNYRLRPHEVIQYMLRLEYNAPGVFTIQGVTLHATYPLPVGFFPVQVTDMACTKIGVGVPIGDSFCSGPAACEQVQGLGQSRP